MRCTVEEHTPARRKVLKLLLERISSHESRRGFLKHIASPAPSQVGDCTTQEPKYTPRAHGARKKDKGTTIYGKAGDWLESCGGDTCTDPPASGGVTIMYAHKYWMESGAFPVQNRHFRLRRYNCTHWCGTAVVQQYHFVKYGLMSNGTSLVGRDPFENDY